MNKIAIFYHCLFQIGDEILPSGQQIIYNQMQALKSSGLEEAATEIHIGVNGAKESEAFATGFLPEKADIVYHGLESRAENLTIVMLENWAREREGWHVLYFHSKGATHAPGVSYGDNVAGPWREGMMQDLIVNWRQCVSDLKAGHDIACSHWMWNMADGTQHIPAGNFLWLTSSFARKLPSIYLRERIKGSGIAALESRYEAEVYWGNGPRPNVKSYRPNGGGGVP